MTANQSQRSLMAT